MPKFFNLLLIAIGTVWVVVSSVARANLCKQTLPEASPCNCTSDGQIWCPDFWLRQSCRNQPDPTILCINCYGRNLNSNLTKPFGIDFSVINKLEVSSCLVNVTLKDTLDKIGIRNVRSVRFDGGTRFEHQLPLSGLNLTMVKIYVDITLNDDDVLPDSEQLEAFDLQNSTISVIPNNFLSNKPFLKNLCIANNHKLRDLPEIFAIPSLKTLHLQRNNISRITSTVFSVLTNLTQLDLKANPIKWMAEDAFRNNRALTTLHLRFDDEQLPECVFEPLESLTELRIVGGRLRIIQEQLFRNLRRLLKLDLSGNQLAELKGHIFRNLYALENLDLAKNQLQSIIKEIFPNSSNLTHLSLNGNKFSDIPSSPNYISPFDRLNHLSELSLESNQLTNIGSWADKPCLKVLKMINNLLTSLDISAIPRTLRELDLSYNSIKHVHVSDETLNSSQIQLEITLDGDSLSKDCQLVNFVRLVRRQRDLRVISSIKIEELIEEQLYCELEQPLCPKECQSCRLFGPQRQLVLNCSHNALEVVPPIPMELHLNASSIVLDVHNNRIRLLPTVQSNPGFGLVNSLLMDNNLFESWSVANLHDNLTSISLKNNTLQNLDIKLVDAIMALPELKQIHLHDNHWPCHCALAKRMLLLQSKISNFNTLTCGKSGRLLSRIDQSCENHMLALISISFLTLVLIAVGFAIYYRNQKAIKTWLFVNHLCISCVSEAEADAHLQYDAFISYSHHDEDFVASELVPALEAAPQHFRLCIHVRDFIVGLSIESQIITAIANSRRTIVYVTRHFLQSEWTRHEFRLAFEQSLRENRTRLIVILASDVSERLDELDPYLRVFFNTTTYLRKDDVAFWRKLLYAMPRRSQ